MAIVDALRESARNGVLAPAAGVVDYYLRGAALREEWGGPFNGQAFRTRIADAVLDAIACEVVIETGSFRGSTTEYFAKRPRLKQVFSVEGSQRYFDYAKRRLRRYPNVMLTNGDSRAFIARLAARPDVTSVPTFFYLDAHWEKDLPLGEELRLIDGHWKDWVAMIDDFCVPDDPGYGFDAYGAENRLDVAYLSRNVADLKLFFPTLRGDQETGMRRGSVVVTTVPRFAGVLRGLSSLLRQP